MLARVFNSAKASCDALRRGGTVKHFNTDDEYVTYFAIEGWGDIADCEDKDVRSEREKDIVNDRGREGLEY